jgi:dihydrofolate reductase
MRKVILLMGMGLDGVGARGWSPAVADEAAASELHEDMWEDLKSIDTFIFGRVTYELWKNFWPAQATNPSSSEFEKRFSKFADAVKKVVFSTTLKSVDWQNTSLASGDISEEIRRLKQQPGKNLAIVGGPKIAHSFTKLNLIDEYHLYVHPTIVGEGTTLLGGLRSPRQLHLLRATTFKAGVVGLQLKPAD